MSSRKPTRRDFLKAAGVAAGVGARVVPATAQAVETLANYGSHSTNGRGMTTSTTGQHLTITAYGDHVVRVRGPGR